MTSIRKTNPLLIGIPPVFSKLPEWYTDRLAEVGAILHVRRGEQLKLGNECDGFVGVARSGILYTRVHSSAVSLDGIVTEFFRPGQFLTLPAGQPSLRVFAATDAVLVGVPYPLFLARIDKAPADLLRWEMDQLHHRLRRRDLDRLAAKTFTPEARLASLLWGLAEPLEGGSRLLTARVPQSVIAEYLGMSREEVSRKKIMLKKSGYLSEKGRDMLLDPTTPSLFGMVTETASLQADHPTRHSGAPLDIPAVPWLRPGAGDSTPVASLRQQ